MTALAMLVVVLVCIPVILHGCSDSQCEADGGRGWAIALAPSAAAVGGLALSGAWFRLTVTPDRLITRGPWWRTQSVPLREVTAVSFGGWGMRVEHTGSGHRSGKPLTVWAIQTGNLNQWIGRG